jgi:hypothetical protein
MMKESFFNIDEIFRDLKGVFTFLAVDFDI